MVRLVEPAFERDPENRYSHLSGQRRGGIVNTAPAQAIRERRCQRRELDALALLKLGVGGNDGLPPASVIAAILKQHRARLDGHADGINWG